MSKQVGWISLHRKILQHQFLKEKRPFTKFEAWVFFLLKGNHRPGQALMGDSWVPVARGSFITSQQQLSDEFNWSRGKVQRFLKLLKNGSMIEYKTCSKWTTISIVKYNTYQQQQSGDDTTGESEDKSSSEQQTSSKRAANEQQTSTNNNINNNNNYNNDNKCVGEHTPTPDPVEDPISPNTDPELEALFEPITAGASFLQDSRFINSGKRPLKKYPLIFLTPSELQLLRAEFMESNMPPAAHAKPFRKVQAKLQLKKDQGQSLTGVSAYVWLSGWAKSETLRDLKEDTDLGRSQNYYQNSKGQ